MPRLGEIAERCAKHDQWLVRSTTGEWFCEACEGAEEVRGTNDLDECACGDYRRDHVNGTGRCKMPDDLTHGFQPCLRFRLVRQAAAVHKLLKGE